MAIMDGQGRTFDSLEEMMQDYELSLTRWQRFRLDIARAFHRRLRNPLRDGLNSINWAYQRVVRGWDDRALWSLDGHIGEVLGQQLVVMAETSSGYPPDYGDMQWAADLKKHGEALQAYAKRQFDCTVDDWDALYVPAQEALRWVANNLAGLRD